VNIMNLLMTKHVNTYYYWGLLSAG